MRLISLLISYIVYYVVANNSLDISTFLIPNTENKIFSFDVSGYKDKQIDMFMVCSSSLSELAAMFGNEDFCRQEKISGNVDQISNYLSNIKLKLKDAHSFDHDNLNLQYDLLITDTHNYKFENRLIKQKLIVVEKVPLITKNNTVTRVEKGGNRFRMEIAEIDPKYLFNGANNAFEAVLDINDRYGWVNSELIDNKVYLYGVFPEDNFDRFYVKLSIYDRTAEIISETVSVSVRDDRVLFGGVWLKSIFICSGILLFVYLLFLLCEFYNKPKKVKKPARPRRAPTVEIDTKQVLTNSIINWEKDSNIDSQDNFEAQLEFTDKALKIEKSGVKISKFLDFGVSNINQIKPPEFKQNDLHQDENSFLEDKIQIN